MSIMIVMIVAVVVVAVPAALPEAPDRCVVDQGREEGVMRSSLRVL